MTAPAKGRLLVVDDDRAVRSALRINLSKAGHEVTVCASTQEALVALRASTYDVVLTDVRMPGETGLVLLEHVKAGWPNTQVVVMTGFGSVEDAVLAMKAGAADYLIKPIGKPELLLIVERALEHRALRVELVQLRREVQDRYGFEGLVGSSPAMQHLFDDIAAVADTTATVLLLGETGTGKELLAHALHYRSDRARGPLVPVHCAAIPETLLESELFGHERGSFSGAVRQHKGKFEQAHGGTVLLDEIGELDLYTQVKLLRVLESGTFQRVGGSETVSVDVRVVAATHRDLRQAVRDGQFREDLYYRLNVVALRVPPLRERPGDVPLLVEHFVKHYAEKNGRPVPGVSPDALARMERYPWPGNVRQLQHVIERAVILSRGDGPLEPTLPDEPLLQSGASEASVLPPQGTALPEALAAYERRILIEALREADGVQARAARRLGVSRSNLNYRVQRLDIQIKDIDYD